MSPQPTTPSMVLSDQDLMASYPDIPWRKAIPISSLEDPSVCGLGCRFGIARFGLKGEDIGKLPRDEDDFIRHMLKFHPEPGGVVA